MAAAFDTLGCSLFHSLVRHFACRDQKLALENRQTDLGKRSNPKELRLQNAPLMHHAANQRDWPKSRLLQASHSS